MDYLDEYNPDWPTWFDEIRRFLHACCTEYLRIEHVGSTSVPEMVARPIIDIDVVVIDGLLDAAIQSLVHGQGDLGIAGLEAFSARSSEALALPSHHLYACEESSFELRKHICFRNYLRAFSAEASLLSDLKRHLCVSQRLSRQEYIVAKHDAVQSITEKALVWCQ